MLVGEGVQDVLAPPCVCHCVLGVARDEAPPPPRVVLLLQLVDDARAVVELLAVRRVEHAGQLHHGDGAPVLVRRRSSLDGLVLPRAVADRKMRALVEGRDRFLGA